MIGSIFALLSATSFATNKIFIRRAVLRVSDASLGILISVPMAVPLFFLILVFSGKLHTCCKAHFPLWRNELRQSAAYIVGENDHEVG